LGCHEEVFKLLAGTFGTLNQARPHNQGGLTKIDLQGLRISV